MQKVKSNQFLESALAEIPRLLGQLNRNPASSSYGSFDRAFWHYRTNDISCARYQEAVYTLALLYCSNIEGNIYYQSEKFIEWIRAALRFTVGLQRRNGSFDEWYINEGSYVATAFVSAAVGQTMLLLRANGNQIDEEESVDTLLARAVEFLLKSKEETVLNQVSGAIFSIAQVGHHLDRPDFILSSEKLLNSFLSQQSGEGWWSEYGGPDIGYLSLTLSYLEKYQNLHKSSKVSEAISKAKSLVESFIYPDGTAGGEVMSRNTEYIVPSSFLPYLGAIGPANLDDRYLCYILYNWIETGLNTEPKPIKTLIEEKYYKNSSLLRVNNKYFLAANGNKGGSFRLYADGRVYYDSGIEVRQGKNFLSTGILDRGNNSSFSKGSLKIAGSLKGIKEPLLDTKKVIAFKAWQLLFGQLVPLQKIIKKFLRKQMISYATGSDLSFEREIEYGAKKVVVIDRIKGVSRDNITFGHKAAYSAVPSSKYATPGEVVRRLEPVIEELEEGNTCIIKRTFSFN